MAGQKPKLPCQKKVRLSVNTNGPYGRGGRSVPCSMNVYVPLTVSSEQCRAQLVADSVSSMAANRCSEFPEECLHLKYIRCGEERHRAYTTIVPCTGTPGTENGPSFSYRLPAYSPVIDTSVRRGIGPEVNRRETHGSGVDRHQAACFSVARYSRRSISMSRPISSSRSIFACSKLPA